MGSSTAPAWKQLLLFSLGRQGNPKVASFCQLATVRPDGTPANRTIVYRGFVEDSCRMVFYTDTRSAKVQEMEYNPWAEVCWYLTDTWEQFRLLGRTEVVDSSSQDLPLRQLRERSWQGLSEKQRATWRGQHPGSPRLQESQDLEPRSQGEQAPSSDHEEASAVELADGVDQGKPPATGVERTGANEEEEAPLDCFCLLLLSPCKVDYLSIKEDRRSIHTLHVVDEAKDTWVVEDVSP